MKIKINKKYKPMVYKFKTTDFLNKSINKTLKIIDINVPINLLNKLINVTGLNFSSGHYLITKLGFSFKTNNLIIKKYKHYLFDNLNKLINNNNIKIGSSLRQIRKFNINLLKNIASYRGIRHYLNLPTRGQRTCSNAKTRKKFKIF